MSAGTVAATSACIALTTTAGVACRFSSDSGADSDGAAEPTAADSIVNSGYPGGCTTLRRHDDAMSSPESPPGTPGKSVDRYSAALPRKSAAATDNGTRQCHW